MEDQDGQGQDKVPDVAGRCSCISGKWQGEDQYQSHSVAIGALPTMQAWLCVMYATASTPCNEHT